MKGTFPPTLRALLSIGLFAAALLLGLPLWLRYLGGTTSLPPLSSLPPVPTPAPPAVAVVIPARGPSQHPVADKILLYVGRAPMRLSFEVAARRGDYQYWGSLGGNVSFGSRDIVVPVLRSFLDDPDAFIRMRAAVHLGSVGDYSGNAVLWQMAHAPAPIRYKREHAGPGGEEFGDVRDLSILILAERGLKAAAPLCVRSFEETGDITFAVLAVELGAHEVIPALLADDARQRRENRLALGHIETFGRAKVQEARSIIEARFREPTPKRAIRGPIVAAWAMIQLGERGPYYDYLLQQAQFTVEKDGVPYPALDYVDARNALKYLATVHTTEVQALLERALEVKDHDVRAIALANLCMGGWEPPSEVARQKLIFEFGRAVDTPFSWNLLLRLAAHSQDPEVRAAAERACVGHPADRQSWRKASEEEIYWPSSEWLGSYMVR